MKGGYTYIDPETGKVLKHKEITLKREKLKSGIAGYSKDGLTVWIDEDVPPQYVAPVFIHENVETVAILDNNYSYANAHKLATNWEKKYVVGHGGDWNEYKRVMRDLMFKIAQRKGVKDPEKLYFSSSHRLHHKQMTKGKLI